MNGGAIHMAGWDLGKARNAHEIHDTTSFGLVGDEDSHKDDAQMT
jgi:hypothetical protein